MPALPLSKWRSVCPQTGSLLTDLFEVDGARSGDIALACEALHQAVPRSPREVRRKLLDLKRSLFRGVAPSWLPPEGLLSPTEHNLVLKSVEGIRHRISLLQQAEVTFATEMRHAGDIIMEALQLSAVQEGIALASPDLYRQFKWYDAELGLGGLSTRHRAQIEYSVVRYFARAVWKATPNSVWSGVAALDWDGTALQAERNRLTKISWEKVESHLHAWLDGQGLVPILHAKANPTATLDDSREVITYLYQKELGKVLRPQVPAAPWIQQMIDRLADEPVSGQQLCSDLSAEPEAEGTHDDYYDGFEMLRRAGLVTAELSPPVGHPEPLMHLHKQIELQQAPAFQVVKAAIETTLTATQTADDPETDLATRLSLLERASEAWRPMGAQLNMRSFLVDTTRPCAPIPETPEIMDALTRSLKLFFSVYGPIYGRSYQLADTIREFRHRFGMSRIPLIMAAGLPTPPGGDRQLFDRLLWRAPSAGEGSSRYEAFLRLVQEATRGAGPGEEVVLDPERLAGIASDTPQFPTAVEVLFQASVTARGNPRIVLNNIARPPGRTAWRFASLLGRERLATMIHELLRFQKDGEKLAALNFRTGTEADNMALCPPFVPYEIELLTGQSSLPRDRVLRVADLTLGLELDGGNEQLVLRSKRTNERIQPVVLTPSMPIYDPLADILALLPWQGEVSVPGKVPTYFPWETETEYSFLPRVVCDRWVVSRARWVLAARFITWQGAAASDYQAFYQAQALRAQFKWPRHLFVRTDKVFSPTFIDLDNPWLVRLLGQLAQGAERLYLEEALPGLEDTPIYTPEGEPLAGELWTGLRLA